MTLKAKHILKKKSQVYFCKAWVWPIEDKQPNKIFEKSFAGKNVMQYNYNANLAQVMNFNTV